MYNMCVHKPISYESKTVFDEVKPKGLEYEKEGLVLLRGSRASEFGVTSCVNQRGHLLGFL